MSKFYEQVCYTFIRPSRQNYTLRDLGPQISNNIRRYDFTISNQNSQKIAVSYYCMNNNLNQNKTCVIYLHSMNGSRLQSLSYVPLVINSIKNCSFCSFDFAGSGNSEGEYVSLGYYQHLDLKNVMKHLKVQYKINSFILWGRSMGASTILKTIPIYKQLNTQHDIEIQGAILDSPFCSLKNLAIEIAQTQINLPQFILRALLIPISTKIKQIANFSIEQLQLLQYCSLINFPVLLLASKSDSLIDHTHSQKIYKAIKSFNKQIFFVDGQHNDERNIQVLQKISSFIFKCIQSHNTIKNLQQSQLVTSQNVLVDSKRSYKMMNLQAHINRQPKHRRNQSSSLCVKNRIIRQRQQIIKISHYSIQKNLQKKKRIQKQEQKTANIHQITNKSKQQNLIDSPQRKNKLRSQSSLNHTPKIKLIKVQNHQYHKNSIQTKIDNQIMNLNKTFEDKLKKLKTNQSLRIKQKQDINEVQPFEDRIFDEDKSEEEGIKKIVDNENDDNHFNIITQKLKLCKNNSKKNNERVSKQKRILKSSKSIDTILVTPRKMHTQTQTHSNTCKKVLRQQHNGKWLQVLQQKTGLKNKNQLSRSKPIFQSFCGINGALADHKNSLS